MKHALPAAAAILSLIATACSDVAVPVAVPVAPEAALSIRPAKLVGACGTSSMDLIAGQHYTAGSVTIENDETTLTVTVTTSGGWTLSATHLAAATTLAGIPRNKPGNPVPGQFPVKASHAAGTTSTSASFSLASLGASEGQNVLVAVHADVANGSQSEGAWGAGTRFVTSTWATYSSYTVAECSKNVLILSNTTWDNAWVLSKLGPSMPDITFTTTTNAALLTPSFLSQFKAVLLFENGIFSQSVTMGNALGSYVQNGGNVVLGTFYWQDRNDNPVYGTWNAGWGLLETLDPLQAPPGMPAGTFNSIYEYRAASLNPGSVVAHPLTTGVSAFSVSCYPNGMEAKPGATVVARYLNGAPLLAYVTHGLGQRVVAVAAFPAHESYCPIGGDFYRVWQNAIRWAAAGSTPTPMLMAGQIMSIEAEAGPAAPPTMGGTSGKAPDSQ